MASIRLEGYVGRLSLILRAGGAAGLAHVLGMRSTTMLRVLSSLILLPCVGGTPRKTLLSVNANTNFPNVPLAVTARHGTACVSSINGGISTIGSFIRTLKLGRTCTIRSHLRRCTQDRGGRFSIMATHTLTPLPVLIRCTTPFLGSKKLFIVAGNGPSSRRLTSNVSTTGVYKFSSLLGSTVSLPRNLNRERFVILGGDRPTSISLPHTGNVTGGGPLT